MLHGQSLIPSHEQAPADASAALSPEEVGGGQCVGDSSVRVGEREASAAHGLSAGTRVYVCVCVCVWGHICLDVKTPGWMLLCAPMYIHICLLGATGVRVTP